MENLEKRTQEVVFQTCLLLIKHFRNLIEFQNETNQIRLGYNSRIFEYMLHKEDSFVFLGESASVGRILVSDKTFNIPSLQSIAAMPKMSDSRIRPTKSFRA